MGRSSRYPGKLDLDILSARLENIALRYFQAVADARSVRKAGERLNVSPSAVSRQIVALEDQLRVRLFERTPHGVKPTQAGEILLYHAIQSSLELRHAMEKMSILQQESGLEFLRVALAESVYRNALPRAMKAFWRLFPDRKVQFQVVGSHEAARQVHDGDAHVGIGFNMPVSGGMKLRTHIEMPVGAVMSPAHPLARSGHLSLESLRTYPLFVCDSSLNLYNIIKKRILDHPEMFNIRIVTNSINLMVDLARESTGIVILSLLGVYDHVVDEDLVFCVIEGDDLPKASIDIAVNSSHIDNREITSFVGLITDEIKRCKLS
jgi:DNA-binding transcriptional LysR family regulator